MTNPCLHKHNGREKWPLVTYELVECENQPVEVEDCRKIRHHFRRTYLKLIKENPKDAAASVFKIEALI
jgi:hypothetical protein